MLKPIMLKPIIAATAVLALAGSSIVYAQQGGGNGSGGFANGPRAEHHRFSADDMAAFTDARIAALKAGLELTPDQAKNWPAFEQALRNMAQLRLQRFQARQAREAAEQQGQAQTQTPTPTSPFDRLSHRADNMAKMGAALKQIADTGAPLYQSLTDDQKGRFRMLARILRPHPRMHQMARDWREGHDGHGWGRDGGRFGQGGQGQDGRHEGRQFGEGGHGGWRHHHELGENGGSGGPGNFHNLIDEGHQGDQGSQL